MVPSLLPLLAPALHTDGGFGHPDAALVLLLRGGLVYGAVVGTQTLGHDFPPDAKERTYHAAEGGGRPRPHLDSDGQPRGTCALCDRISPRPAPQSGRPGWGRCAPSWTGHPPVPWHWPRRRSARSRTPDGHGTPTSSPPESPTGAACAPCPATVGGCPCAPAPGPCAPGPSAPA